MRNNLLADSMSRPPRGTNLRELVERSNRTELGYASILYERLMKQIAEFEQGLTKDEEIGGYLASFGQKMLIRIQKVEYNDPYLVVYDGMTLEGEPRRIQLIHACLPIKRSFDSRSQVS